MTHSTRSFIIILLILIWGSRPGLAEDIVITDATVHLEPGKVMNDATIVIRDGQVKEIGRGIAIPASARRIEGKGKVVTAGLIESGTRLGLVEVDLESTTQEGAFYGKPGSDVIHAAYRVVDGYNPASVAIPVARAQGITSTISRPEGGLISGASGWFSLADATLPDVVVRAPLAMYASLGEESLDSAQGSRGLAIMRLREVLDDAQLYSRLKRSYERNQTRDFAASRLDLEALIPVVQGRLPLVIRANRSSDILAAIALARDTGVRIIIEGGAEAWMVARELAVARIGVILSPEQNLPSSFDSIHVRDDGAKVLADAGVDVAISTLGDASAAGTVRQLAGIAVANGLSRDQALAALTSVPAKLFGVDRGTIAVGKAADLVVWSGDPFELSTRAEHVMIAGKEQSIRSRQTLLLERYRKLPP